MHAAFSRTATLVMLSLALPVGSQAMDAASSTQPVALPISGPVIALAKRCAPDVHPLTTAYLVAKESSSRRFAINVNEGSQLTSQPTSAAEAREAIERLEAAGINYDVGYAQINSANFDWLDVTGVELLDGCANLRASQRVLMDCYQRALNDGASPQPQIALRDALSCYNTGSMSAGYENGYVASVERIASAGKVPELLPGASTQPPSDVSSGSNQEPSQDEFGEPDAFASGSQDAFSMGGGDGSEG